MSKLTDFFGRNKKLAIVVAAAAVVGFVIFSGPKNDQKKADTTASGKGVVTKDDNAAATLSAVQKELAEFKKQYDEEKKAKEAKKAEDATKGLPPLELGASKPKKEGLPLFQTQQPQPFAVTQPQPPPPPPPPPRLQKKQLSAIVPDQPSKDAAVKAATDQKIFTLPASSFVEVKLLSGAYATQGEPLPVAAIVERAFVGPNKSTIPLKGCQIIGKAKGDIGYEIAQIQATRLVCVWPDGSVLDEKVNGWFTTRPGVLGVAGKVEKQSGKFFASVGVASFLEGFSQGLARTQEDTQLGISPYGSATATNISGNATKYGLMKGAQDFAGVSKAWFQKQAEALTPAVLVQPGTKAYVFMLESVKLKGAYFDKPFSYFDNVNVSAAVGN